MMVFHNEDGNPARANIKQALGSYERLHKGIKASVNSDIMYFFTSAQDGDPLQDDVRLCLGDDLKKAQDHTVTDVPVVKEKQDTSVDTGTPNVVNTSLKSMESDDTMNADTSVLESFPPLTTSVTTMAGDAPVDSIRVISEDLYSAYGFFLGRKVAYLVLSNYVGIIGFGLNSWLYLFDGFSEDGLSAIATNLGTPLMLDSYTFDMCMQSWGRSSYARVMIELRADVELKDYIVVAMPKITRVGHYTCNVRIEYEWKPPRSSSVWYQWGTTNLVNNGATSSRSSYMNVDNSSSGTTPTIDKIGKFEDLLTRGKAILVDKGWQSFYGNGDYDDHPYNDDMYDGQDLSHELQAICDNLDIRVREDSTSRTKKYEELSLTKKLQVDCDLKDTNGVLQGLPPDVYAIVNHHKVPKEICDGVKLLMQGTKLSLQERECKLYDEFDTFSFVKGKALYQYCWRFAQLINNMNVINMSMRPVQVNIKFLNSLPPEWSKFMIDVKLARDTCK
ncbi:hypothetical protein Tco_0452043 [Tanacetum coccineum]